MKTAFPNNISSRAPQRCRALTILEMLVSTALLAFIVLGLTAMFIQTQKAFKTGIKQTSVTDAGRSILDMIAADLSQLSDPHFTNVNNPLIPIQPTLFWQWVPLYDLYQFTNNNNNVPVLCRTNQLEDVFVTVQTNANWLGIGYSVSNWFTNSAGITLPGIGTLYRYCTNTATPLTNYNILFPNFYYSIVQPGTFTNCHRIADGVVHFKIYTFDASGNENPNETNSLGGPLQYPTVVTNFPGPTYQTNFLPHSIDIELGVLEPEAFEHARALYTAGAWQAASNYLATAVGQVEIFRQHIIIPAAP